MTNQDQHDQHDRQYIWPMSVKLVCQKEATGNGNACDGLTSKHEGFNWCGLTEFLLVSSDPSPGENLKDSQRLEPQFAVVVALSLTGLTNLLVIDCLHSIVIDTCTCLQD